MISLPHETKFFEGVDFSGDAHAISGFHDNKFELYIVPVLIIIVLKYRRRKFILY